MFHFARNVVVLLAINLFCEILSQPDTTPLQCQRNPTDFNLSPQFPSPTCFIDLFGASRDRFSFICNADRLSTAFSGTQNENFGDLMVVALVIDCKFSSKALSVDTQIVANQFLANITDLTFINCRISPNVWTLLNESSPFANVTALSIVCCDLLGNAQNRLPDTDTLQKLYKFNLFGNSYNRPNANVIQSHSFAVEIMQGRQCGSFIETLCYCGYNALSEGDRPLLLLCFVRKSLQLTSSSSTANPVGNDLAQVQFYGGVNMFLDLNPEFGDFGSYVPFQNFSTVFQATRGVVLSYCQNDDDTCMRLASQILNGLFENHLSCNVSFVSYFDQNRPFEIRELTGLIQPFAQPRTLQLIQNNVQHVSLCNLYYKSNLRNMELHFVNLSDNNITELTGELCNLAFPNLKAMDYSYNCLRQITVGVLDKYVALEWLSLRSNALERLESTAFNNLIHLQYLDASHNNLLNAFYANQLNIWPLTLTTIDLSYNFDLVLNASSFLGLRDLDSLKIDGVKSLHRFALAPLKNLRFLSMDVDEYNVGQEGFVVPELPLSHLVGLRLGIYQTSIAYYKNKVVNSEDNRLGSIFELLAFNACDNNLGSRLFEDLRISEFAEQIGELYNLSDASTFAKLRQATKADNESTKYPPSPENSILSLSTFSEKIKEKTAKNKEHPYVLAVISLVIVCSVALIIFAWILSERCPFDCICRKHNAATVSRSRVSTISLLSEKREGLFSYFYGTTPLHGFLFAKETNNVAEKLFWHITIVCFTALLAREVYANWCKYLDAEPQSSFSVINSPIFPQQPFTLCFNIIPDRTILPVHELFRLLQGTRCQNLSQMIGRQWLEALPWSNNAFFYFVLRHLATQFTLEGHASDMPLQANPHDELVTIFEKRLQQHHASLEDLRQLASAQLCMELNLLAFEQSSTDYMDTTLSTGVVRMNAPGCYDLFQNSSACGMSYASDSEICVRFPGIFEFAGKNRLYGLSFRAYQQLPQIASLDLNGYAYPISASMSGSRSINVRPLKRSILDLNLMGVYSTMRNYRNEKDRCVRDCFATHRTREIVAKCKCQPIMWNYLASSEPSSSFCTLERLNTCNISVSNVSALCETSVPCVRYDYIAIPVYETDILSGSTLTQIVFQGLSGMYQLFEEIEGKTLQEALSELGGSVGLWLGGSFLGFIHIVLFGAKTLLIAIRTRNQKVSAPHNAGSHDNASAGMQNPRDSSSTLNMKTSSV